ncbi:MAG: sulfatase-like hydrolase/transferase [Candidatus Hydrogenedens sp.]|nr:sulfatase-like hydrolase/transferase [Candidatus Hydrogenedens sp.]
MLRWILGLAALTSALSAAAAPPNIVILYADDMGYGDLGIQNPDSKIPTPHLDQLAREGMRFTDAHSSSGICTPSRYALLTGRYHWRKFHDIVNSFDPPVFDAEPTLASVLKAQGYATACIGKWHLGWDWDAIKNPAAKPEKHGEDKAASYLSTDFDWSKPIPGGPLARGFDYYFGDDVPNFPPYTWIENDRVLAAPTVPYAPDPRPEEGSPEGRPGPMVEGWKQDAVMPTLTKQVVDWIAAREGQEQPFFLYFPWTSPHAPIVPAKEWIGSTKAGGFGDYVHQSDAHAGTVLAALEAHGFRENTLVVFTADNGPEHYAYERVRKFDHRSMGPLRGLKRDIWEGGHRVPFVVRWPGHIEAGSVNDALIGQIDLMATIAAIAGAELPPGAAEDSINQLPVLRGDQPFVRRAHVHNTFADGWAMRLGDWLLIDKPTGDVSKVPEWYEKQMGYSKNPLPGALFNLKDDLPEQHNHFAEQPERVEALQQLLATIRAGGAGAKSAQAAE